VTLDGQSIGTLLIAVTVFLLWANTKLSAAGKSQRVELKHRRALDVERIRRLSDLEETLAAARIEAPAIRPELTALLNEDW